MAINTQKVVVGGLVGGVVVAVLDFLFNGVLFAAQNEAVMAAMNAQMTNTQSPGMVAVFVGFDVVFGLIMVWTYAAMRPRFGAGAKTALFAVVQVWLVSALCWAFLGVMGVFPWSYYVIGAGSSLVSFAAGGLVGCKLYNE